jgi:hypothetical protein
MKSIFWTLFLFTFFCFICSFQCNNCKLKHLKLDATKSWLPLKGKNQLVFTDNLGNLNSFSLKVIDTTETAYNDCGEPYKYEYIKTTLYLNNTNTDSIHFSLSSGGWLCMNAVSNSMANVSMCNVFGQTREGRVAKRLNSIMLGNKIYNDVILLLSSPALNNNIDSIYIANNKGYIGFKYGNKNYTLQ